MRCYALVLCLLLIPFAASSATTYVVNPDGTGDCSTIQAAIDAHWGTVLLGIAFTRTTSSEDLQ